MGFISVKNTSIKAIYSSVPKQKYYTKEYSWVSPEERLMFEKTTGISERRVAPANITCSDLCFQAASELIKDFDYRNEIDLLVFVSQSPDYFLPSTAVILQNRLGLSKNTMAFDINLGCSGYVYGLSVVGQFIHSGNVKNALLLCGDKSTISTNYQDKILYRFFKPSPELFSAETVGYIFTGMTIFGTIGYLLYEIVKRRANKIIYKQ